LSRKFTFVNSVNGFWLTAAAIAPAMRVLRQHGNNRRTRVLAERRDHALPWQRTPYAEENGLSSCPSCPVAFTLPRVGVTHPASGNNAPGARECMHPKKKNPRVQRMAVTGTRNAHGGGAGSMEICTVSRFFRKTLISSAFFRTVPSFFQTLRWFPGRLRCSWVRHWPALRRWPMRWR
jgi:hypothetical protein